MRVVLSEGESVQESVCCCVVGWSRREDQNWLWKIIFLLFNQELLGKQATINSARRKRTKDLVNVNGSSSSAPTQVWWFSIYGRLTFDKFIFLDCPSQKTQHLIPKFISSELNLFFGNFVRFIPYFLLICWNWSSLMFSLSFSVSINSPSWIKTNLVRLHVKNIHRSILCVDRYFSILWFLCFE